VKSTIDRRSAGHSKEVLGIASNAGTRIEADVAELKAQGLNVNLRLVAVGAAAPYFYAGRRGRYADRLEASQACEGEASGLWRACPRTPYDRSVVRNAIVGSTSSRRSPSAGASGQTAAASFCRIARRALSGSSEARQLKRCRSFTRACNDERQRTTHERRTPNSSRWPHARLARLRTGERSASASLSRDARVP
jgi:hypothetical protein